MPMSMQQSHMKLHVTCADASNECYVHNVALVKACHTERHDDTTFGKQITCCLEDVFPMWIYYKNKKGPRKLHRHVLLLRPRSPHWKNERLIRSQVDDSFKDLMFILVL